MLWACSSPCLYYSFSLPFSKGISLTKLSSVIRSPEATAMSQNYQSLCGYRRIVESCYNLRAGIFFFSTAVVQCVLCAHMCFSTDGDSNEYQTLWCEFKFPEGVGMSVKHQMPFWLFFYKYILILCWFDNSLYLGKMGGGGGEYWNWNWKWGNILKKVIIKKKEQGKGRRLVCPWQLPAFLIQSHKQASFSLCSAQKRSSKYVRLLQNY